MAKRKIIFLDVDGVLNSDHFIAEYLDEHPNENPISEDVLDKHAINRVYNIVTQTGALIVVSSSWRWDEAAYKALKRQLSEGGVSIYDCTHTELIYSHGRAQEIQQWLDENKCDNFVIIDDAEITIPELAAHHVKTTFLEGLNDTKMNEAISILNQEEN